MPVVPDPVTDAPDAGSSPAPVSASEVLANLSPAQREAYDLTGELPDSDTPASVNSGGSPPAEPAEQAASTEASHPAASDPATSGTETPETYKEKTEARFQELLAERRALRDKADQLERRLADLETSRTPHQDAPPASSSPASLAQALQQPDLSRPPLTDTAFYTAYPEATLADFTRYVSRYEVLRDRQERAVVDAREGRIGTYRQQVQAALKDDPAFLTGLHPRVASLVPLDVAQAQGLTITADHVIAQAIVTADDSVALLKHFSSHPDELDRIGSLGTDAAMIREIGRLEARLSVPPPASPSPGKTVSTAPAPPPTLGSRPTQPVNGKAAALARKDFLAYAAEANAEDVATTS